MPINKNTISTYMKTILLVMGYFQPLKPETQMKKSKNYAKIFWGYSLTCFHENLLSFASFEQKKIRGTLVYICNPLRTLPSDRRRRSSHVYACPVSRVSFTWTEPATRRRWLAVWFCIQIKGDSLLRNFVYIRSYFVSINWGKVNCWSSTNFHKKWGPSAW